MFFAISGQKITSLAWLKEYLIMFQDMSNAINCSKKNAVLIKIMLLHKEGNHLNS